MTKSSHRAISNSDLYGSTSENRLRKKEEEEEENKHKLNKDEKWQLAKYKP